MKEFYICLSLFFYFIETKAQDSLAIEWLDEVVVTGQYEPQSARNSVYEVRVIPMELIQVRGAVKLEDVLRTQLNMRFSQDATIGNSRLSMQGLSGQNVKILIDGVPVTGRQGVLNEIDINQINVHTIERIEIVEGPMSIMYGADALAGVINIITKKNKTEKWNMTVGVIEKSAGNEYSLEQGTHNQNIGGQYVLGKWYVGVDLAKNYFGGWKGEALGRDKAWNPKDQIMATARVGFKLQSGEMYYRMNYLYENIYNPGPLKIIQSIDEDYITNRFMHQIQGSYTFSERLDFSGIVSYTDYRRKKRTIVVDAVSGQKTLALGKDTQDEINIDGVTTRGTCVYKINSKLAAQAGFDINLEQGKGGRIIKDNKGMEDYALFGSVEWKPLKGIQLRAGLRFTYNSVYGAPPVTPSLNTKWTLSNRHAIRLSYGRGFRAPSLRELYFNFFDSNHSIEGNTDLNAETSHSVNGTWNWKVVNTGHIQWSVLTGGFYNLVKNRIDFGRKPENTTVVTYINIDTYQTQGFTLRNKIKINQLDATVDLSYINNIFWSPEVIFTLSYTLPKANLIFYLYYKYTGPTPIYTIDEEGENSEPEKISSFHTADLTVQKKLFDNLTITVGVNNVFDVTSLSNIMGSTIPSGTHSNTTGTTPIGYGRSYFVGLAYVLKHKPNKANILN